MDRKSNKTPASGPQPQFIHIEKDTDMRCPECEAKGFKPKLFFKGEFGAGTKIEIKCPRCKTICRYWKI